MRGVRNLSGYSAAVRAGRVQVPFRVQPPLSVLLLLLLLLLLLMPPNPGSGGAWGPSGARQRAGRVLLFVCVWVSALAGPAVIVC